MLCNSFHVNCSLLSSHESHVLDTKIFIQTHTVVRCYMFYKSITSTSGSLVEFSYVTTSTLGIAKISLPPASNHFSNFSTNKSLNPKFEQIKSACSNTSSSANMECLCPQCICQFYHDVFLPHHPNNHLISILQQVFRWC